MRNAAFATLALFASLAYVPAADACAMFRPPQRIDHQRLVAQAKQAEKAGEHRHAIRLYERVLNHDRAPAKVRAEAGFDAGRLYEKTGKIDQARARQQRAVALNKGHGPAQLALGRLFAGADDAQSIRALQAALKTRLARGDEAEAEALMALGLARQAKVDAASKHLERARLLGADADRLAVAERALRDARGGDGQGAVAAAAGS